MYLLLLENNCESYSHIIKVGKDSCDVVIAKKKKPQA